jgi:hypothetical protein
MPAQLALDRGWTTPQRPKGERRPKTALLCASCQEKEARYGFRPKDDDPLLDRPRTLCFECFRVEIRRRQEAAVQARLPLEQTLDALSLRRRRAQIAARHAVGL